MAKVWDKPITADTDWGGDASTDNLPVSGRQVQAWIKGNIKSDAQISQLLVSWLNANTINSPVFWKGLPIDADTLKWEDNKLTVIGSEGEDEVVIDEEFLLNFLTENGYLTKGDYPFVYDAEKKAWLFTGDLVATGAITMFGDFNKFKPSTIMDAIVVDGITIDKTTEGVLYVKDGGGSGGSGLSYEEISQIVSNAIQNKADKATTLKGYGIEDAYDKSYIDTLAYKLTTVYNWGDHSKAGYLLKDTPQEINADKHNFVKGLKIGGLELYKSKDDVVFLDANLVVRGAITMYGDNGTTSKTIWESIPFDSSMKWDGSKWSVVGGGPGGGVDANAVNVLINEYLTTNKYATQSWVEGKGYITQHQSLSHLLSKTDAANTYQPIINSSNKLAYSLISGTPSSLPASDVYSWAKAATKPSYTAAEVGALATSGGTISGNLSISTNGWGEQLVLNGIDSNAGIKFQYSSSTSATLYCAQNNPYWQIGNAVYNILHSGNIGSYNAGSATKLQTPRTIWGQSFDGTADIAHGFRSCYAGSYNGGVAHSILNSSDPYGLLTRINGNGSVSLQAQREANNAQCFELSLNPLGGSVLVGNVVTPKAKLHIEKTALVEYEYNHAGQALGTLYGLGVGTKDYGISMWTEGSGRGFIQQMRFDGATRVYDLCLQPFGGNVAVGRTTADAKLHVGGDLLTDGVITMYSQASLKNIIDKRGLGLEELAKIKPTRFYWKDGRDDKLHIGGIADEVMQVLPEVVYRTSDDKLTMDYGSAAFYIGASLIKPVIELWDVKDNHEKRIVELERENKRKDEIIISLQNQLK